MFALPTVPDGVADQRPGPHPADRRRALRRLASVAPTCPAATAAAMPRSLRDVVLPLPDDTLVLPGHGPATTIEPRARHQPLPARTGRVSPSQQRSPRSAASPSSCRRERIVEQHFLDVIRETFELHGFASVETRAVEPIERLAQQGRGRRQGDLRDLAASPPARTTSAATPRWGCTSTSPCRSRATCWRTPAGSHSRSAATRSRRCGAASGRRRAATASSPRPTSTSSTSVRCRPTTRPRCRWSSPRCSASCRSAPFRHPGQQPQDPRGLLPGLGLDRRQPAAADRRQARQDRARAGSPRCWSEAGATAEQADRVPRAGRDPLARPRRSSSGCAPSAWSTRPSTRASTRWPRSSRAGDRARARRCSSPTCGSPAASTTTPAPSTRPSSSGTSRYGSICSGGRYDALASDGRTTYPGVGISIGVSRLLGLLVGRGPVRPAAPRRPACSWPSPPRTTARQGSRGRRGAAPPRHPVRGGPGRGEVRQADPVRRAARHPVRLVPGRGGERRPGQGHPLAATRSTPTRPPGSRRRTTCDRTSSPRRRPGRRGPRPSRRLRPPGPEPPAGAARCRAARAGPARGRRPGRCAATHRPGRRRPAPAACIGWRAMARSANRSRSASASMNRCAAVARRTNRTRSSSQRPATRTIGMSAVNSPSTGARWLDGDAELGAGRPGSGARPGGRAGSGACRSGRRRAGPGAGVVAGALTWSRRSCCRRSSSRCAGREPAPAWRRGPRGRIRPRARSTAASRRRRGSGAVRRPGCRRTAS